MLRRPACLATLLCCSLAAAPAQAQRANGLYEPFPQPLSPSAATDQALRYLERLGPTPPVLSATDLRRGLFVEPATETGPPVLRPAPGPGAASSRAGVGGGGPAASTWPIVVLALFIGLAALGALRITPIRTGSRGGRSSARALGAMAAVAGLTLFGLALPGSRGAEPEPPVRAEPLAPDFLGIVSDDLLPRSAGYRLRMLKRQDEVGITLLRQTFDWAQIERRPGRYDFKRYDRLVQTTAEQGFSLLPILFNPPPFRSSAPRRGARRGTYPPRRYADMGVFAAALVRRYGPTGTFWAERPLVPRHPIRSWQVWNEPSLPAYWPAGPDAREYTALLAATSRAIKAADPGAEVVTAGVPESRLGVPFRVFVTAMYRAGAARSFDTFAIHPYAGDAAGTVAAVSDARRLMDENGDRAAIWVTEIGWASDGPASPFTVGADGQATRIRTAILDLAAARQRLRLRGIVYYNWRDAPPARGARDFWGLHTGLIARDGRAKPATAAFGEVAREVGR